MRLDLFPLEAETDEGVLVRLIEECGEVIQAASKMIRFGPDAHPAAPPGYGRNLDRLKAELDDVALARAEIERRWPS